MTDDWVKEDLDPVEGVRLTSQGVQLGSALAPWSTVFGVAEAAAARGELNPSAIYVLVPRRPPLPPWFEVRAEHLPADMVEKGLVGFAHRVRARTGPSDYRSYRRPDALMPPDELLRRALAREELPGALEVPVAEGPGRIQRRIAATFGTGTLGGVTGLALAAIAHLPPALGIAGLVAGAAIPTALSAAQRRRKHRPRVLLLSPDGCVVGFTTGIRAFSWAEVDRFEEGMAPLPGTLRPKRPCLRVITHDAGDAGTLDAAWFEAPLSLIVAVAEAYRTRQNAASRIE